MKILIGIGALLATLILLVVILMVVAQNAPPPQITANFTELDKIEKISKYRSCAGHTTVPQDMSEMKRSMKHYFWVKPEFLGGETVKIFAPYDGYVSVLRQDSQEGLEGEIWIAPKDIFVILPPIGRWMFSVQHINIRDGLKQGGEVKAGDLIGYGALSANNRDTFDIVFAKGSIVPKKIDNWRGPFSQLSSVFDHMSDEVFSRYSKKGIASKEELIISKDQRDKNPCVYKEAGPYFLNQYDPTNWAVLK